MGVAKATANYKGETMGYQLIDKLLPKATPIRSNGRPNSGYIRRPGYSIKNILGIIVHSTANIRSNALGEAAWLTNITNDRAASWHSAIDDSRVVTVIPHNEVAYGTTNKTANWSYIQLEICESGNREQVIDNTIHFIASICLQNNLNPAESVFKHADFQDKNCPRIFDNNSWAKFISDIVTEYNIQNALASIKPFVSDQLYWDDVLHNRKQVSYSNFIALFNKLLKLAPSTHHAIVLSNLFDIKVITSLDYWYKRNDINSSFVVLMINRLFNTKGE